MRSLAWLMAGLLWGTLVWAECLPGRPLEQARVAQVTDGDTLRLRDGRRVRLIGLNAPELHPKPEPLAREARDYLIERLPDGRVWLHGEAASRDEHGRYLMHAFDARGQSLVEGLLAQGLGFLALFPPALVHADCLAAAQQRARQAGLGVWREKAFGPLDATQTLRSGFVRLRGKVLRVDSTRAALWVQLQGDAVLKIEQADLRHFSANPPTRWTGRQLEVTGWLVDRQRGSRPLPRHFSRWVMVLRHPSSVHLLPDQQHKLGRRG